MFSRAKDLNTLGEPCRAYTPEKDGFAMRWVSGVVRSDGALKLIFQDVDGGHEVGDIRELRNRLPFGAEASHTLALDLCAHEPYSTKLYLDGVGHTRLDAGGQECRKWAVGHLKVVIPDQLLVVGLVGSSTLMRAALLSPQGPKALTTTSRGDVLATTLTPNRNRTFQADRIDSMARMAWIGSYPSATRAWSSVYARALQGRLGLTMPCARAVCRLAGTLADDTLYVTELSVTSIQALEPAHEFCSDVAQKVFRTCTREDRPRSITCDRFEPMSDEQWTVVQEAVRRLSPRLIRVDRTYSLRDRIDAIRLHLSSGVSFYRINLDAGLRESARVLHRRLQVKSLWPELDAVLRSTFGATGARQKTGLESRIDTSVVEASTVLSLERTGSGPSGLPKSPDTGASSRSSSSLPDEAEQAGALGAERVAAGSVQQVWGATGTEPNCRPPWTSRRTTALALHAGQLRGRLSLRVMSTSRETHSLELQKVPSTWRPPPERYRHL